MRKSSAPPFERETDLCAAFIAAAGRDQPGWRFYPETEGWDILAVRTEDHIQVGIEAKLRLNNKVVAQALPSRYSYGSLGPDFRAVLVPAAEIESALEPICDALGVTVISLTRAEEHSVYGRARYSPHLPDRGSFYSWHEWSPAKRHPIPDYVPDVAAGASAPLKLTPWKIQAIKLAIVLGKRPITRADFRAVGIDPGRWTDPKIGWLQLTPSGYVASERLPDFKTQHPTNYEQIKADQGKWDWSLQRSGSLV